jgi:hypothetical protein
MGSGSEMRVSGGPPLKSTWTYVPGGAGAGGSSACPHTARLPGKPRASRNRGWRGTQRGAWRLRGCHSIPIHTYPGGTLGMMVGRPGQVRAEMLWLSVPKVG